MPEQFNEQQQHLQKTVAALCNDLATAGAKLKDNELAERTRQASKQAGLFTMTQPRAFGGSEAGSLELCLVRDEAAAHNLPTMHALLGPGPGVLGGVGEPLRSSHLQPLLDGHLQGSFGFTEPDDAQAPTSGTIDGDSVVVNGQKSYVTGGGSANFINTLVRIDGAPAMVVIDTDSPGVRKDRTFTSLDGSQHAAFTFDSVKVPRKHVIGEPGEGLPKALGQIGDTRLAIAATCVGLSRWVIGYLTEYLSGNDRSGAARHTKETIRLRYAALRVKTYAARSMLYRTARIADRGDNVVNEAISCKIFATDVVTEVVDEGIQLVGGHALEEDHPLAHLYRKVRSWRLAEGATDVLLLNIARGTFDLGKGRL